MSEVYNKCIVAPNVIDCASLLTNAINGNLDSINQFKQLKSEYAKGLRLSGSNTKNTIERIKIVLFNLKITLLENKTADEIIENWLKTDKNLASRRSDPAKKIASDEELKAILIFLVEFVINPEFSGAPETMKTSKAWFSRRPNCTEPKRVFSAATYLKTRPTPKKVNFRKDGTIEMVGGGSQNERKNLSYVNKIRYLDSLNNYYSMVGGAPEPTNCGNDLKAMYENITNNLQLHGKQVENSDNRIIETMLNKFTELENKVLQINENIAKLSGMSGANVSGVLQTEKEKLKMDNKALSTQGKNITSVIRNLFENSSQVPDNNKTLSNARLQFPQHTIN
jgi:hypothetical protein